MQFLITPRRHKGIALQILHPKRTTVIRGDLTIKNQVCEALHRHSSVATVCATHDPSRLLLPELFDANLSAMAREGFTLSGIEFDGKVWYAQSWWCRTVD